MHRLCVRASPGTFRFLPTFPWGVIKFSASDSASSEQLKDTLCHQPIWHFFFYQQRVDRINKPNPQKTDLNQEETFLHLLSEDTRTLHLSVVWNGSCNDAGVAMLMCHLSLWKPPPQNKIWPFTVFKLIVKITLAGFPASLRRRVSSLITLSPRVAC